MTPPRAAENASCKGNVPSAPSSACDWVSRSQVEGLVGLWGILRFSNSDAVVLCRSPSAIPSYPPDTRSVSGPPHTKGRLF